MALISTGQRAPAQPLLFPVFCIELLTRRKKIPAQIPCVACGQGLCGWAHTQRLVPSLGLQRQSGCSWTASLRACPHPAMPEDLLPSTALFSQPQGFGNAALLIWGWKAKDPGAGSATVSCRA